MKILILLVVLVLLAHLDPIAIDRVIALLLSAQGVIRWRRRALAGDVRKDLVAA